jgi:glycosyltransferase involved in cell wall biosynthesis
MPGGRGPGAEPAVSVIIPAHDAERHLAEAIESTLGQDLRPVEVVVVDDGSSDGTAEVARRYAGVTVVQQDNAGAGAARNTGVARATGELYAFLDADDVWLPGKLRAQAEALHRRPHADGAFCGIEEFHSPELDGAGRAAHPLRPGVHVARAPSGLLLRAASFARVGPFRDGADEGGELIDWLLRAAEAGLELVAIPDLFVRRRIHATNMGVRAGRGQRAEYVRSLKRALDRRRAVQR